MPSIHLAVLIVKEKKHQHFIPVIRLPFGHTTWLLLFLVKKCTLNYNLLVKKCPILFRTFSDLCRLHVSLTAELFDRFSFAFISFSCSIGISSLKCVSLLYFSHLRQAIILSLNPQRIAPNLHSRVSTALLNFQTVTSLVILFVGRI